MKFTIIAVGKLSLSFIKAGTEEFIKRLRPYAQVTVVEMKEERVPDKPSCRERELAVEKEGEHILKMLKPQQYMILLDVYGKAISSEHLLEQVEKEKLRGISEFVFVIGGTYGVSEALRKRANMRLSLSPMTFTHQMARLLLVEQLYRICKMSHHEPYHW